MRARNNPCSSSERLPGLDGIKQSKMKRPVLCEEAGLLFEFLRIGLIGFGSEDAVASANRASCVEDRHALRGREVVKRLEHKLHRPAL